MTVHALVEVKGGVFDGRCGAQGKRDSVREWTAWEDMVTCPECISLRSPAQQKHVEDYAKRPPYRLRPVTAFTTPTVAAVMAMLAEVFPST